MVLLKQIIEKAREIRDQIEMGCHYETVFSIDEIEGMLMQVPAGVEDWADAMRDEAQLLSEARQWMVRDHLLAIEKINLLIERFEAIDRACAEHHTAPEMPEDVSDTDELAVTGGQDATHWFG